MKPSLVPIACGTALAVMAGAAAAHWCSVRDMVKLAGAMPSAAPARPVSRPLEPSPLPDEKNAREAEALLAQARGSAAKPVTTPVKTGVTKTGDERFERFLSAMEGILEENRQLRDNIADTNRDLMELQFRVDMYDGEFRPLKVEEEPQMYDGSDSGVLPPLDASFEGP